jgi:hypothetical protein
MDERHFKTWQQQQNSDIDPVIEASNSASYWHWHQDKLAGKKDL